MNDYDTLIIKSKLVLDTYGQDIALKFEAVDLSRIKV